MQPGPERETLTGLINSSNQLDHSQPMANRQNKLIIVVIVAVELTDPAEVVSSESSAMISISGLINRRRSNRKKCKQSKWE